VFPSRPGHVGGLFHAPPGPSLSLHRIAGGLAWLAVLAVGSLGEQVKTRLEVAAEEENTKDVTDLKEVVLPSGVRFTDLRVGGGQTPPKGYLVVLECVGRANGEVFEDTERRGKPQVFLFGSRPPGWNAGLEQVLSSMKAGGKRRAVSDCGR
jgi:FKBP-type peptidyl-prolyl cis-trans isomerase